MVIKLWYDHYSHDALHIFAENANDNQHNVKMLQLIESPLHKIPEVDLLPKNIPRQKINEILSRKQNETGLLAQSLQIKLNALVILAIDIDLQDRQVNGQLGTVKHISIVMKGNVTKIYIKFDNSKAKLKILNTDTFAMYRS